MVEYVLLVTIVATVALVPMSSVGSNTRANFKETTRAQGGSYSDKDRSKKDNTKNNPLTRQQGMDKSLPVLNRELDKANSMAPISVSERIASLPRSAVQKERWTSPFCKLCPRDESWHLAEARAKLRSAVRPAGRDSFSSKSASLMERVLFSRAPSSWLLRSMVHNGAEATRARVEESLRPWQTALGNRHKVSKAMEKVRQARKASRSEDEASGLEALLQLLQLCHDDAKKSAKYPCPVLGMLVAPPQYTDVSTLCPLNTVSPLKDDETIGE